MVAHIKVVSPIPKTSFIERGTDEIIIVRAVRIEGFWWWKRRVGGYTVVVRVGRYYYSPAGIDFLYSWEPRYFSEEFEDARQVAKSFLPVPPTLD